MAEATSILHVDDDADIRLIVDIALRLDHGLRIAGAASTDEALALLADPSVRRPDALLLDYRIGGANALDLLDDIRAIAGVERIPVIFLTAHAMPKEIVAMQAAGAAGVLTKPFNPLTLARQIRVLIGDRTAA